MNFEINTHCWNYYKLLTYHLSGFVLHPATKCNVTVSVCYSDCDENTVAVLDYFQPLFDKLPNVHLVRHLMEPSFLMRRGIGRNERANLTEADWMWYADCDMVIHGRALDELASVVNGNNKQLLRFPKRINISTTHRIGDALIYNASECGGIDVPNDVGFWTKHRYTRAIGGVQICHGDHLRRVGYLPPHSKWLRPVKKWRRTYEDKHFRSHFCNHRGHGIRNRSFCNNIFRIRHGQCGRNTEGVEN